MMREHSIRKTLKLLSKQRVGLVLQPGNIWVIEMALPDTETHNENLQTCLMRGWIDVLHDSIPTGNLEANGSLLKDQPFNFEKTVYRLTDGGWNVIHRTHVLTILSIIATLVGIGIVL